MFFSFGLEDTTGYHAGEVSPVINLYLNDRCGNLYLVPPNSSKVKRPLTQVQGHFWEFGFFQNRKAGHETFPGASQDLKVKAGVTQVQRNFWKFGIFLGGIGKEKPSSCRLTEGKAEK